jgi:uncharacterized protein (TIGR02246 family)
MDISWRVESQHGAEPASLVPMEESTTKSEAAIRALVNGLVEAIRAKDLQAVMAAYAPDMVAFDIVPPLQYIGADAFRKPWQEVFELYENPIEYEVRDLRITARDDVAFSHSLNRMKGTMKNGKKTDLWLRWTACYRKTDGRWRIAHLQASVPADMASGKAVLDLHPPEGTE